LSVEPEQYANQGGGRKESIGALVAAGRQSTVLLELAEEVLDEIAGAIQRKVGFVRLAAIGLRLNERRDVALVERRDQRVGVVALVGEDRFGLDPIVDLVESRHGLIDIGGLAGRERQRHGIAIEPGLNFLQNRLVPPT
jgi:hypothetical protein